MIRAIVFDFDGVLADSEPLHLQAYQEVFSTLGIRLTRDDYYSRYLGYNDEDVFRTIATEQGWGLDDSRLGALIAEKCRVFDEAIAQQDVLYPGAVDCVERLAREFPLGIASGALRHEIEAVLTRAGLAQHIRFIVGSGDTPRSKPHPDPYLRAVELHGIAAAACVAIEDSHWGLESARGAGMKTVGIATTYSAEELTGADRVIATLEEFDATLIRSL